jgi:hypothetical protein
MLKNVSPVVKQSLNQDTYGNWILINDNLDQHNKCKKTQKTRSEAQIKLKSTKFKTGLQKYFDLLEISSKAVTQSRYIWKLNLDLCFMIDYWLTSGEQYFSYTQRGMGQQGQWPSTVISAGFTIVLWYEAPYFGPEGGRPGRPTQGRQAYVTERLQI